ncbi:hypothetical protein F383_27278 [Gossypium arboreum]|uniref:Uncharacterized protein n=1 Tax=Gossypium arboreum TaxID=29729 RepID=A0A0B0MSQ9_GOSAR|nr:hypothetical protein F383_27278 [Gossypium arboreum]
MKNEETLRIRSGVFK